MKGLPAGDESSAEVYEARKGKWLGGVGDEVGRAWGEQCGKVREGRGRRRELIGPGRCHKANMTSYGRGDQGPFIKRLRPKVSRRATTSSDHFPPTRHATPSTTFMPILLSEGH